MSDRRWPGQLTAALVAVAIAASAYLLFAPPPGRSSSAPGSEASTDPTSQTSGTLAPGPSQSSEQAAAAASAAPTTLPVYDGPVRDRARADLLRQALMARLAAESAGEDGASDTMPGSGNQADAALGNYVAHVMHDEFAPLATSCYEALLERDPSAEGSVLLQFSIAGDRSVGGVVIDASLGDESTLRNAEFSTCVSESLYSVVFDAPPEGHPTVTVKQSLEFAP
jgi:hypothetical protein